MSGMAGDTASTDEVSDPIQPDVRHPDTFASRTPESASAARERMARKLEPGENQSTTRRLSDTPTSMRRQFQQVDFTGSAPEVSEVSEQSKTMMEKSREAVAKALGGGSRGAS